MLEIIVLSALLLAAEPTTTATKCSFGSISLPKQVSYAEAALGSQWKYRGGKLNLQQGLQRCVSRRERTSVLQACVFENDSSSLFRSLHVFVNNERIHRVSLQFSAGRQNEKILSKLRAAYGEPSRKGTYNEEAFVHNLVEWNKGSCRVVYDFGGLSGSAPTELILEWLPPYPGGYVPGTLDEILR